jgi:predicted dienelactone hydrolase
VSYAGCRKAAFFGILVIVLLFSASAAQARQLPGRYDLPGRYGVGLAENFTIHDSTRGVNVPARVRFPLGAGPFPLIAFSHGLGANREAFETVAEHWASHGYIVVRVSHDDSGVGMSGGGMHPSEEKVRERVGDVLAVLNEMAQVNATGVANRIDPDRIAVAGHSYGSFITLASGGITIELVGDPSGNLGDPRIQCILPVSPSGRGDYGMSDGSFDSLTIPMMMFAGTNDIRNGRAEDWRMEPYRLSPAGEKYLVVIEGATHNSYGGGGGAGNVPTYVKAASTAFFESCLRGSAAAVDYLTGEDGFREFAGDSATIEFK